MYGTLDYYLDKCLEEHRSEFSIFSLNKLSGDDILMISGKGYCVAGVDIYTEDESCWYNYEYHILAVINL